MRLETSAVFGVPIMTPQSFVRIDNKVIILEDRQLFINVDIRYHLACEAIQEHGLNRLAKALIRARAFLSGLLMSGEEAVMHIPITLDEDREQLLQQ